MKAQQATIGAKGVDTVTPLVGGLPRALRSAGVDFAVRYLGSLGAQELQGILDAGLALSPVTYADRFDGLAAAVQLNALQIPPGTTVWLDLESVAPGTSSVGLVAGVNGWCSTVSQGGWQPGLYVGAGALLTSGELYALDAVRYWHSMSQVVDRNGQLAEPRCGWCLHQLYPTTTIAGVSVDVDYVQADWEGRLPSWVVAD